MLASAQGTCLRVTHFRVSTQSFTTAENKLGFHCHYWYLEFNCSLFLLSGGTVFSSLPNQDIFLIKDWVIWLEKQRFWIDDLSIFVSGYLFFTLCPIFPGILSVQKTLWFVCHLAIQSPAFLRKWYLFALMLDCSLEKHFTRQFYESPEDSSYQLKFTLSFAPGPGPQRSYVGDCHQNKEISCGCWLQVHFWVRISLDFFIQQSILTASVNSGFFDNEHLWKSIPHLSHNKHPALKPLVSETMWECWHRPALTFSFLPFPLSLYHIYLTQIKCVSLSHVVQILLAVLCLALLHRLHNSPERTMVWTLSPRSFCSSNPGCGIVWSQRPLRSISAVVAPALVLCSRQLFFQDAETVDGTLS